MLKRITLCYNKDRNEREVYIIKVNKKLSEVEIISKLTDKLFEKGSISKIRYEHDIMGSSFLRKFQHCGVYYSFRIEDCKPIKIK